MKATTPILVVVATMWVVGVSAVPRSTLDDHEYRHLAESSDSSAAVWALLLPRADGTALRPAAISAQIAQLGRDAIEPIIGILFGDSPEPDVEYDILPIAIDQRYSILCESLHAMPPHEVVVALKDRLGREVRVDQVLLAVRLLALVGGGEALDQLVTVVSGLDPIHWQRASIQTQIQDSFVRLLAEDSRNVRRVTACLARVDPAMAPMLVRALGTTRTPLVGPVLVRCLGRDPGLDLCVLRELSTMGSCCDMSAAAGEMGQLRALLESQDQEVKRGAALALARMGDEASCSSLIAMLESKDALAVRVAQESLRSLTGLSLGADAKTWTTWRELEATWFEDEFPRIAGELSSGDVQHLTECAHQFLAHKLYRHQAALALQPVLTSPDPELLRQVCSVLGLLGSPQAAPWLLNELDNADEVVRNEAWNSLRVITGCDLPLDAARWKSLISP